MPLAPGAANSVRNPSVRSKNSDGRAGWSTGLVVMGDAHVRKVVGSIPGDLHWMDIFNIK